MEVNISTIMLVYDRAETLLYLLKGKVGLNDTVLEPLAIESSTESSTDLLPWPTLAELNATYRENSPPSAEQTDSDTTTCSDRASNTTEDATANWTEGNSTDWAVDPAAADGGPISADGEDTSEESDDADQDWDTDNTEETEYTDHEDDAEWSCLDRAADQGIAAGGWDDA
ncbi:MAG: hypothetical protein Q9180_009948 [Flavoplaca navasiana]